jgi:hypothetical protein
LQISIAGLAWQRAGREMKKLRIAGIILITLCCVVLLTREFLFIIWITPDEPDESSAQAPASTNISVLSLPVDFPIQEVARIANQLAPSNFSDTYHVCARVRPRVVWRGLHSHIEFDEVEVGHVDYDVSRGPIDLRASGDHILINVPLSAHAKEIPGSREGSASGIAHGSTTLTVAPDYNLDPAVDLVVDLDHAEIIGINIRGFAEKIANDAIKKMKGELGGHVARAVNLRGIAEKAWRNLPRCVRVPGTSNVWLRINPKSVMLEGPNAREGVVTATLALQTTTEVFVQSTQPPAPVPTQLPDLRPLSGDRRFHVALPVEVQMAELNRALTSALHDKRHQNVKVGDGQSISLKSVSVFPKGNRLFLKVAFEGNQGFWLRKTKGTFICGAVPHLDVTNQVLSFGGVDFTPQTQQAFSESAAWLLKPVILHEIQKRLTLNLAPLLAKAAAKANKLASGIKLPAPLQLDLNVEEVSAEAIRVYGETVCIEFAAAGNAKLSLGK